MHSCVLVADEGDIYELLERFTYDETECGPDALWDYMGIGGRYEGALPLKEPRLVRRFFGLLPAGSVSHVSVAKKREIDQATFLAAPPVALFFNGQLHRCPLFAEGEALAMWQAEFRQRFAEIPDDATLQIVDAHS